MKQYEVKFKIFNKCLKTTVDADNKKQAIQKVKDELVIISASEVKEDDKIFEHILKSLHIS